MHFIVTPSVLDLIVQEITGEKKQNSPNKLILHLYISTTENRMRGFTKLTTFSVDIENYPHFKEYPFKAFRVTGSFWSRVFASAAQHAEIADLDRDTFLAALPRGTLHIQEDGEVFFEARNLLGLMEARKSITHVHLKEKTQKCTVTSSEVIPVLEVQEEHPTLEKDTPIEHQDDWKPVSLDGDISTWDDIPKNEAPIVKLKIPHQTQKESKAHPRLDDVEELDAGWLEKPRFRVIDDEGTGNSISTETIEVPIFQKRHPLTGWA